MTDKRVYQVGVRLDEAMREKLAEYAKWIEAHAPALHCSEAEAARSLLERGYQSWQREIKPKKTRVT